MFMLSDSVAIYLQFCYIFYTLNGPLGIDKRIENRYCENSSFIMVLKLELLLDKIDKTMT